LEAIMSASRLALPLAALALILSACDAPADGDSAPEPTVTEAGAKTNPENPADEASPAMNANEPDAAECGADQLDRWLNVLPTETVKAEIREAVGHDRIRYIAPGDVVTMDLRPDRLNVETGVDGRIKLFRCG
jgi:hypothetical protein